MDSQRHVPKMLQENILSQLITQSDSNDTKLVFTLLKAKRKQLKKIQALTSRPETCLSASQQLSKKTKNYFNHMPTIRKTPNKLLTQSTFQEIPHVKQKKSKSRILPEECEIFWSKIPSQKWKPETRQEATLTPVDSKLYLIGGVSRSINYDINVLMPGAAIWEKLYPKGVEPDPRFGHSALEYKGKIVVFGGGTNFNTIHKLRECLNGIKVFDPLSNEWDYMKTNGTYISTRKYHSASIVGKHLFIYGGLNQKNNLLSDFALLNLEKKTWKSISIEGAKENAFQTSISVLGLPENSYLSIFKTKTNSSAVKKPGIYIFGGIGSDKRAHNKMFLVEVGQKPLQWSEVETVGKGPCPRFMHTMNKVDDYILIFGGRIDLSQTNAYTCFNDVYMLCMKRLLWVKVNVLGDVPSPRSGHCSAVLGSAVYIFGGVSNTCYCSSDMFVIETNRKNVESFVLKEERKKKLLLDIELYKEKNDRFSKSVLREKSSTALSRVSATPTKYMIKVEGS